MHTQPSSREKRKKMTSAISFARRASTGQDFLHSPRGATEPRRRLRRGPHAIGESRCLLRIAGVGWSRFPSETEHPERGWKIECDRSTDRPSNRPIDRPTDTALGGSPPIPNETLQEPPHFNPPLMIRHGSGVPAPSAVRRADRPTDRPRKLESGHRQFQSRPPKPSPSL